MTINCPFLPFNDDFETSALFSDANNIGHEIADSDITFTVRLLATNEYLSVVRKQ
jgi:hypothetical protein